MAEWSKTLDFESELEIATIDLVLYRLSPLFCLIRSSHRPVDQVMTRVLAWMGEHGLILAKEKTEIVRVDREIGETKNAVKYLDVTSDPKIAFRD
ncbi:hypothetical protein J6590_059545 [Homalodisca vitripennis]|nr:hypothetical protein J6590_059545 [Homalodisca vitripennis]